MIAVTGGVAVSSVQASEFVVRGHEHFVTLFSRNLICIYT